MARSSLFTASGRFLALAFLVTTRGSADVEINAARGNREINALGFMRGTGITNWREIEILCTGSLLILLRASKTPLVAAKILDKRALALRSAGRRGSRGGHCKRDAHTNTVAVLLFGTSKRMDESLLTMNLLHRQCWP